MRCGSGVSSTRSIERDEARFFFRLLVRAADVPALFEGLFEDAVEALVVAAAEDEVEDVCVDDDWPRLDP